ncbi:MAG: hypothetical protein ACODAA_01205, partial [Gemmatimonadota bacterium]
MRPDDTEAHNTHRPDHTSGARTIALGALAGVLALGLAACGDDDGGPTDPDPDPTTGSVEVSASTTGEEPDPDGYTVTLDGANGQSLAIDGTVTFEDVDEGEHAIELTDVAANCSVDGANPKSRTVTAGETATATFDVVCTATTGSIEVTAATTGDTLDADGYEISLDGGTPETVGVDGTVTFADVPAGDHDLEISDVQRNCSVSGDLTTTVTVTAEETATADFDVSCQPALFNRILFYTTGGSGGLHVINPDGTDPVHLIGSVGDVLPGAISPDGTSIVFTGETADGAEIFIAAIDGTGAMRITNNSVPDLFPTWSPDGTRIAFLSDRNGTSDPGNIYVMDVDGSNVTPITDDPDEEGRPVWSPDGSLIAFGRGNDGVGDVFVVEPDGTGETNLTDDPAMDGDPAWSPDGSRITFVSTRASGDAEIYAMDADGSNVDRITSEPGIERWPAYTPDGTAIVYTT